MRIVHTSDWHIGKVIHEVSMLEEQQYVLSRFTSLLKEIKPDVVIIAGDLYDRSIPPAQAVRLLDEVLSEIVLGEKIPVLVTAGNHDSPQRLSFGSSLYRGSGLYMAGIWRGETDCVTLADAFGEVDFYLLPYLDPDIVRLSLPEQQPPIRTANDAMEAVIRQIQGQMHPERRSVLVAHGFFSLLGENVSPTVTSDSEVSIGGSDLIDAACLAPFDYAALGHIHTPQQVAENARYSGSLLKYSVSEHDRPRSFTLVELGEKGLAKVSICPLRPRHDLRVIRGSFSELIEAAGRDAAPEDYLYAVITDDNIIPEAMSRLRSVYPNILGLRFEVFERENARLAPPEEVKRLGLSELFAGFYQEIKGEALEGERLRFIEEICQKLGKEGGEML